MLMIGSLVLEVQKKDSFAILESCRSFLLDNLKLELSVDKTLISHFIKEKVLFLGV